MRLTFRTALFALLCLTLAACSREERTEQPIPVDSMPDPTPDPQTKPGSLRVEGMEEPVTLRLVDLPEAPFTTFVPEGEFVTEAEQSDDGVEVRFIAQFGGVLNPDAYALFVFPAAGSSDSLRAEILGPEGRLAREGWTTESEVSPCLWAEEGVVYRDAANDATGIACISSHNGQPFYLLTHYPVEYGDGFGPRLNVILDEFRWRETGAPLRGE